MKIMSVELNIRSKPVKKSVLQLSLILTVTLASCAPNLYQSGLGEIGPSGIIYDKPLVITKGGTYSGNWESQDPEIPAVSVRTSDPVIIENSNVRGRGDLISGFGNRLTVRNVNGYGLNPNVAGWTVGKFVNAEEFLSVRVENSYAENTIGLYFRSYKGNPANGDTVTVLRNKFKNINGLPSNGNEAYNLDYSVGYAHMLMFNNVVKIPNVEIAWNEIYNEPGKSLVEENINIYSSGGTSSSPISIHDNFIHGAYSSLPSGQGKYAGGGIIVGDGAIYAPSDTGYTEVYNNQIISTTNQGIAIAGGVKNNIHDNRVVSSGMLPDGSKISAQNVGLYLWNSGLSASGGKADFSNNIMNNNYVVWIKFNSDGTLTNNPWWFPDCGIQNNICKGNMTEDKIDSNLESKEYSIWLNKISEKAIQIGSMH